MTCRKYSAQSLSWRSHGTNTLFAALLLQAGLVAALGSPCLRPCASPNLAPTQDPLQSDRWHSPKFLLSKDTFCHPPSKLRAGFCDLLFPLSGNLGRRELQMPPATHPQLLIGAAVCIPRSCLGPSGSDSCRSTVCQARIRAEGSEGRIEPSTVTLGSQRLAALIIYSSIIRSKSK